MGDRSHFRRMIGEGLLEGGQTRLVMVTGQPVVSQEYEVTALLHAGGDAHVRLALQSAHPGTRLLTDAQRQVAQERGAPIRSPP